MSWCRALCASWLVFALFSMMQPAALQAQPPRGSAESQQRQPLSSNRLLVEWAEPDSVMRELMERLGYRVVQYQGQTVRFDALTRELTMRGKPSAVQREGTMLVGDTIVYNDSTELVIARGDTVFLRDPSQVDGDDFIARGEIRYDLRAQEGTTGAFATSVVSGDRLYVTAQSSTFYNDTTNVGGQRVFFHGADFTYCDLEDPHFHFTASDIKFVTNSVVVGRSALLYIGEVPVFWLPFFFQDGRSGRRSGMLTPEFGITELFRNSANYQRRVQNVGWFFALNDFADAQTSLDWQAGGAGGASTVPGYTRFNADLRYNVLSRFIEGRASVSRTNQANGQRNTAVTWQYNQSFNKETRLAANVNFVTNTTVQRETTFNPTAQVGTIVSQLNYQMPLGPARISVGGTRKQYPGRDQVETNLPNLNLTMGTLAFGALEWTPSVRFNQSRTDNIDQGLQFAEVFSRGANGGIDSTRVNASRRNTNFSLETPIKIFDFQLGNSISITERFDDYPEQRVVRDVNDTSIVSTRVFAQRFFTSIDWNTSFNLPRFFQGTWNLSPNVNLANSDPSAGLIVRSELSGGRYVSQGKRLVYGVSAAPTFNGIFPGIGPVEAFRHTLNPAVSYTLSPAADVSDDFLQATGRTRQGYLGALPRNALALTFSTTLEAKLRPRAAPERSGTGSTPSEDAASDSLAADAPPRPGDTPGSAPIAARAPEGTKLRLLALNFSSLSYDFIRADTAASGFVERDFRIQARTDLLPNLDFQMGYELFQGDPISDTAVFSPFRTELGVNFSLDGKSSIVGFISRLLGLGGDIEAPSEADSATRASRSDFNVRGGGLDAAGSSARGDGMMMTTPGQGWRASVTYNSNRQRPLKEGGTQIDFNPADFCQQFPIGTPQRVDCEFQAVSSPPVGFEPEGFTTPGGPQFVRPASENVSGNLSFGLTPKWSTSMSAMYDMTRRDFSSLQIGLNRELHDWNAVFSFSRIPNGNFSFNFFISLKANADIKFDYDRRAGR